MFDQYKTLTEGVAPGRDSDPEREIIQAFQLETPYHDVERVVCGTQFHDEDSYVQAIASGLGLPANSAEQIREIFSRDASAERIIDEAAGVLREVRLRGLRTALLSNAATPEYTHATKVDSPLQGLFDVVVYSYDVGLVKPDPDIFSLLLARLGDPEVVPADVLMVGDSLHSDFRGALAVGWQAALLDPAGAHVGVEPRIASLTEVLDLVPAVG